VVVIAPRLEGRWIRLRPVTPDDYAYLYALTTGPEASLRWRYHGLAVSPEAFEESLWNGVTVQFIAASIASGEPLGLVVAYNTSQRNRFTYVAAVFDPGRAGGAALEAVALLVDHAFAVLDLRKVYAEVSEFNLPQFASVTEGILTEEARLHEHLYLDGRYWDNVFLSVTAERWHEVRGRVLRDE